MTKAIFDLVNSGTDLLQGFKKVYSTLDDLDKFFFCSYSQEYLGKNYYGSFFHSFLKKKLNYPENQEYSSLAQYFNSQELQVQSLRSYERLLTQGIEVLEFILLRLPHLRTIIQRKFSREYYSDLGSFAQDSEVIASHSISTQKFRVDITNNHEDYIYKVGKAPHEESFLLQL